MTKPNATVESTQGAFEALARLKRLEQLMDRQFSIAGIRFGLDSVIGLVPVLGDLFDVAIKSNTKNLRLLISDFEKQERSIAKALNHTGRPKRGAERAGRA